MHVFTHIQLILMENIKKNVQNDKKYPKHIKYIQNILFSLF